MKILYLSYFSTQEIFDIIEKANLEPSVARQKFDIEFISNLIENIELEDFSIISYLPKNRKIKDTPKIDEYKGKKINYIWTNRINIFEIILAMHKIKKLFISWKNNNLNDKCIVLTYATSPILLLPMLFCNKNIKIVSIVSEVPKFRNMTEKNKLLNSFKKSLFNWINNKMDGYIYFSEHMNDVCNLNNLKPWIVVEGMSSILDYKEKKIHNDYIFYAGGLHYENGIEVLLQSIDFLKNKNIKLVLCGVGNALDLIKEKENNRIQYLGSISNAEVVKYEKEATLLINPRIPDEGLTKYSFPSKTFEYFASGTPCILTKLKGIPNEFFEHCYTCDVSSPQSLANDIDKVLDIPLEDRIKKGKDAYDFLKNHKSSEKQTKKIIDFLENLV